MRVLQDVLTDLGLDLSGWVLQSAEGTSSDGATIVGHGTNPNGDTEAFIARIPTPIPCIPGDLNHDTDVTGEDIAPFVAVLLDPCAAGLYERCAADVNHDSSADGDDVQAFVNLLLGT
jgi:hypothetical protein